MVLIGKVDGREVILSTGGTECGVHGSGRSGLPGEAGLGVRVVQIGFRAAAIAVQPIAEQGVAIIERTTLVVARWGDFCSATGDVTVVALQGWVGHGRGSSGSRDEHCIAAVELGIASVER